MLHPPEKPPAGIPPRPGARLAENTGPSPKPPGQNGKMGSGKNGTKLSALWRGLKARNVLARGEARNERSPGEPVRSGQALKGRDSRVERDDPANAGPDWVRPAGRIKFSADTAKSSQILPNLVPFGSGDKSGQNKRPTIAKPPTPRSIHIVHPGALRRPGCLAVSSKPEALLRIRFRMVTMGWPAL